MKKKKKIGLSLAVKLCILSKNLFKKVIFHRNEKSLRIRSMIIDVQQMVSWQNVLKTWKHYLVAKNFGPSIQLKQQS